MHFVRQDLKPYAQPVKRNSLQCGHVYYMVNFVDEAMKTPIVETIVYVGTDPPEGYSETFDSASVFFQDYLSYSQVEADEFSTKDERYFEFSQDELGSIFEFDNALDELIHCSLRRELE